MSTMMDDFASLHSSRMRLCALPSFDHTYIKDLLQRIVVSPQLSRADYVAPLERYLHTIWDDQYGRYSRKHYVEGQGWVFFDWLPQQHIPIDPVVIATPSRGGPAGYGPVHDKGRGAAIRGSYNPAYPQLGSHYEALDPSFYVRAGSFFEEGKVFSVLFSEAAGANSLNPMADYNTNLSKVKYDSYVHTQIRRFIVVRRKREFCFAVPIFSYGNRGTTKSGVVAREHAIAYSWGMQPQLVHGEAPLQKSPIPIVMDEGVVPLTISSRIYFAIHHPIHYNVRVKSLGYVHPEALATFLGYWNQENSDSRQDLDVTQNAHNADEV